MSYTIATTKDGLLLMATVPDGGDIAAAVARECEMARIEIPEIDVISGLTLTNDEPDDIDAIVRDATGGDGGWLIDEAGKNYRFAVRV